MARVLMTGSSRGIGRATALELAARGHEVIATARRVETLTDLPVAQRLALDVTDQASVDAAIAAAGPIDVLVSNAGETMRGTIESTPLAEFERLYQLNTIGAVRVTQAVLPGMRERGSGRIIYVSSILGRLAIPLIGAYAQTKWALEAIAETLALEVGDLGLHVTVLEPGTVATDGRRLAPSYPDRRLDYARLWERLGQLAESPAVPAEQVAQAIAEAIEAPRPPFRTPVGESATALLDMLHQAPTDQPFDTLTLLPSR